MATLFIMGVIPSLASALPAERHYEKVSPSYKGGYGVARIPAAAPDGERVAYSSLGTFEGATANQIGYASGETYVAHRGALSWLTVPFSLPASLAPYNAPPVSDFSSAFSLVLYLGQPGPNSGAAQFAHESDFFLRSTSALDPSSGFQMAGERLAARFVEYVSASTDLSHLVVEPPAGVPLNAEATSITNSTLYDLQSDNARPLRLVALNNRNLPIDPNCHVWLGAPLGNGQGHKHSKYHAVVAGGQEIFFTTCAGSPNSQQLFVRLEGTRTIEVSRPLLAGRFGGCIGQASPHARGEVPCQGAAERPSAEFVGASEDGSRVFFLTTAALAGGDEDEGNDLYMAVLGCPASEPSCSVSQREIKELVQVSHDGNSEAANVQGVVGMGPDGRRMYFVAHGVLSGENAEHVAPVAGADNVYFYEASGEGTAASVTFVADLCSEAEKSGTAKDARCPGDLNSLHNPEPVAIHDRLPLAVNDNQIWGGTPGGETEVEVAGDGRFLVFSSYGRLTSDDADNALDVYRYDADTHVLKRISVGELGSAHETGNGADEASKTSPGVIEQNSDAEIVTATAGSGAVADQERLGLRVVSEDGSRIVFLSPEPLSSSATNGLLDAYEWHDGNVSLVSTGTDPEPALPGDITMTPSGSDIFFLAGTGLLPQDTDEAPDLYDARLGPDFPPTPVVREECLGDACQGPLTNPAPILVPASVLTSPDENIKASRKVSPGRSKKSHNVRKHKKSNHLKSHHKNRRRSRSRHK